MTRELPRIKGKNGNEYFLDERLLQLRNVNDPHDFHEIDEFTAACLRIDWAREQSKTKKP